MGLEKFIPTVWSAQLLVSLKKAHVFGQAGIVNRDYEGEISGAGNKVKINHIGAINVGTYLKNPAAPIDLQTLTDFEQFLEITEQKYFNFQIDDVDRAQQTPKIMAQAMTEAAYALRDASDRFIASKYVDAGEIVGGGGGITLTANNIYETLIDVSVLLDENNCPAENRWIILPAWAHGLLLKDDRFTHSTGAGDEVIRNAQVGRAAGFNVLISNNVVESVGGIHRIMAGNSSAISFAEQITSVEAYRPENRFADAVKGLHVYGARVVRPECLVTLNAKRA